MLIAHKVKMHSSKYNIQYMYDFLELFFEWFLNMKTRLTIFFLAEGVPDFISSLLWCVLIIRKILLVLFGDHVEYRL